MMKRIASLAILLAVVAMSLNAQAKPGGVARMISMGGAVAGNNIAVNPFIFSDPAWQLVNPAYATMYKDYIWSNIANANGYGNQFSGVNFGLSKEWAIGAVLSYDPSATQALYRPGILPAPYNNGLLATFIGNVFPARPANPAGSSNALPPVEVFEVFTAFHMGTLDLGFGVMYGWANSDTKSTVAAGTSEASVSANVLGFRAGVIVDLSGGSALEGSAALRLDKAKDKLTDPTAGTSEFSASGTEIQATARLKLKMSNRVNFVPYAGFQTLSGEPKEDGVPTGRTATTASLKLTNTNMIFGAGAEYRTSTFYLAGGLSFASLKAKAEANPGTPGVAGTTNTTTYTNFPLFNLGTEWQFTDWLAGRLGYYRTFQNTNTKSEPPTPAATTESNVFGGISNVAIGGFNDDNLVTLGLGFKFGAFALDATVSENALRSALGLIGSATNTFGYMTASYNFE